MPFGVNVSESDKLWLGSLAQGPEFASLPSTWPCIIQLRRSTRTFVIRPHFYVTNLSAFIREKMENSLNNQQLVLKIIIYQLIINFFFKQPFAWKKFRGREDFSPISVHYGIQAEVTPSIIILYWSESSYPRSPDCHISFACVVSAFYMCSIACVSVRHTLHVKYMSTRGQCCLSGLILIKWMLWGVVWYRL